MITAAMIKEKAKELGAGVCGIGDIKYFIGDDPQHNPLSILPNATCIIGFGIPVPKGLYMAMDEQRQYFNYTNLAVKYTDETFAEIFLLKMGALIENEGFDACLQRNVSNLRIKGDKTTNPELIDTYELIHAEPVAPGKPAPDVIIDYNFAAKVCGLGDVGMSGHLIAPKMGPFVRMAFIITDAPLETDAPFGETLCDKCGKCIPACPGNAVSESGTDSWQCAVYYRGAHKSNPFMDGEFLAGNPEKEAIISGNKHFSKEEAREIYKKINFLPSKPTGYIPCICGKACDMACYRHLKEKGVL